MEGEVPPSRRLRPPLVGVEAGEEGAGYRRMVVAGEGEGEGLIPRPRRRTALGPF